MSKRKPPFEEQWDEEDLALADPDQWDWENPIVMEPVTEGRGADFVVPFNREEFLLVADRAEQEGLAVIEFIRRAALATARKKPDAKRRAS